MAELLIKRDVRISYISGSALRLQRQNAGLTQKNLADLIAAATGESSIMFNGQLVNLGVMTISRMEHNFETALDYFVARIIQKILSS